MNDDESIKARIDRPAQVKQYAVSAIQRIYLFVVAYIPKRFGCLATIERAWWSFWFLSLCFPSCAGFLINRKLGKNMSCVFKVDQLNPN